MQQSTIYVVSMPHKLELNKGSWQDIGSTHMILCHLATCVGQCQARRALFWPVLYDIQQVFVPATEVSNSKITVPKPVILLLTAKCVAS